VHILPHAANGVDCGQAPFRVVVVHLEVLGNQGFEQGMRVVSQSPLIEEDAAERFTLVQNPGIHGFDQRVAGDEIHLHREDAEEQIAVCVWGGHCFEPWPDG
jgi:hypothetical protein